MKFEHYTNFMSWWNTELKRWYRMPAGFYPDRWNWACVGLRRTREAYMYATIKCWELRGGEGELPSLDSYLTVPYHNMTDSDATPPSSPPPGPTLPHRATSSVPRSGTSSDRPSTAPATTTLSASGRPVRSNRAVLPSRFKEFQHVDEDEEEGQEDDAEYELEDEEDNPDHFDDFDDNYAVRGGGEKRKRSIHDEGPKQLEKRMRSSRACLWDDELKLTPPPAAQPPLNLFPSDDKDDEQVDPTLPKASKGKGRVPTSDEDEDELSPPRSSKGKAPAPPSDEEEDEQPPRPALNKGKARATIDDNDNDLGIDDDDLGINGDEGVPLPGVPQSLPAFNADLLWAQKYTEPQIQEFRTLYDAMISTCTVVGKNIQTILRAFGLTIAFSKTINAFNIFEAWLKCQPDTPSYEALFFFDLSVY
jgi:hypothetical protein